MGRETDRIGAIAIGLLPKHGREDEVLAKGEPMVWVVDPDTSAVESRSVTVGQLAGDQILVTEAVVHGATEHYDFNDADLHRLSGRSEPVHLYELVL